MMPTTRRAMQMPVMVSTRFWYSSSASRKGQKQRRSQHGGLLGKVHKSTAGMLHTTAQIHTATPKHSHHTSGKIMIDCKENRTTP